MYVLQVSSEPGWELFFGHFHPVVVHLPIGILFIAFVLELVRLKTKSIQIETAIPTVLFWGFITALISCVFGWLLSQSGEYEESTLFWHQWLGISVAGMAGLLWLLKTKKAATWKLNSGKAYTFLIGGMLLLLTFTGHLGGNMTHGEDYLTMYTPQPIRGWLGIPAKPQEIKTRKITDINEAMVYADVIEPLFEAKCMNCHNATKKKGGLRMDAQELLMKGGKHGIVIKPGDALGSEVVKRLLLPRDDDKRMPPKGKPELTAEETELLKWWIAGGASFRSKVKDLNKTAAVDSWFKNFNSAGAAGNKQDNGVQRTAVAAVYLRQVPKAGESDIANLKNENLIVYPLSKDQHLMEISAVNAPALDDAKMKLLKKIAPQIAWLQLANTAITDAGLKELAGCTNLVKLNIENTAVTNNSTAVLKGFPNLQYLNIIGTKIDDSGLKELASVKSLKSIYCWQTGVTDKGVKECMQLNPGLKIELGEITAR